MISFYRKFIPNASTITAPLTNKLKDRNRDPIDWDEPSEHAFQQLKTVLTSDPVLKLPDRTKPFVLRTDSSSSGLGAVLLQYHNREPFPVAYASRKLLDRETRYSTIERECLGIIFGVEKFKYYLLGSEFILETQRKLGLGYKVCKIEYGKLP